MYAYFKTCLATFNGQPFCHQKTKSHNTFGKYKIYLDAYFNNVKYLVNYNVQQFCHQEIYAPMLNALKQF